MIQPLTIAKEIDARGSFCPGPLMELIRTVRSAAVGDVIAVLSSDPGSIKDIPAWVAKANHELVALEDVGGEVKRFIVRKTH
ncbi:sulfurtransferase TusA family protein [Calidithermus chliarophilus]|uniref:sulfurtransferase TusA family protein n=1 Tax=Calidithermus chliarophilus TaxID=52023 RepID=UPI00040615BD|nr:sulfurtransferase TusA family protein [Calidithermus chliarophilus]